MHCRLSGQTVCWRADTFADIAGPDKLGLDEFVRQYLRATQDTRQVVTDEAAPYFGVHVKESSLVPIDGSARISAARYEDWLKKVAVRV
ncbi:hypothetical protein M3194_13125 [Paenibacillus glycanilyticus]|uniref:hypothetical protein n=1 Tax=Paenibacillus glycanilyticus TaxID=126569 RepID=UPI00203F4196|nr:hypothetical protein [Paenibacillus glycanilyticus]MCM3628308.1 hypothetical protein [Paenibacillus glycanilyticus]